MHIYRIYQFDDPDAYWYNIQEKLIYMSLKVKVV